MQEAMPVPSGRSAQDPAAGLAEQQNPSVAEDQVTAGLAEEPHTDLVGEQRADDLRFVGHLAVDPSTISQDAEDVDLAALGERAEPQSDLRGPILSAELESNGHKLRLQVTKREHASMIICVLLVAVLGATAILGAHFVPGAALTFIWVSLALSIIPLGTFAYVCTRTRRRDGASSRKARGR